MYMQIFSSYKTKCGDFKRLFKELPESEQLIVGKLLPKSGDLQPFKMLKCHSI